LHGSKELRQILPHSLLTGDVHGPVCVRQGRRVPAPLRHSKPWRLNQAIWTAFRSALILALPVKFKPDPRAISGLEKFRERLVRVGMNRSPFHLASIIKELALWCRMKSLRVPDIPSLRVPFWGNLRRGLDGNRRSYFVLSQMARALPEPPPEVIERAVKVHRTVLTGYSGPTNALLLEHLEEFGKRLTFRPNESYPRPLGSASFSTGRHAGGQTADMAERFNIFGAAGVTANMAWRSLGGEYTSPYEALKVRVIGLAERGWKARIVTAGVVDEQVRAHVLRDVFFPLLDRLPVAHKGEADEIARCTKLSQKTVAGWWLSTDLTAATDYGRRDVAAAVWKGVLRGLVSRGKLDEASAEHGWREISALLGPHEATYPDSSVHTTTRGWLMGNPLTWLTLNLVHCGVLDAAGLLGSAVVKGDDALVRGSRGSLEEYLFIMEMAGFKINRSKTFWSRESGLFCEVAYSKEGPIETVPVKELFPLRVESLAQLDQKLERFNQKQRSRIVRFVWASAQRSGLLKRCSDLGIPTSAPRCLGGLGLPHRRRLAGSLRSMRTVATACLTSVTACDQIPRWATPAEVSGYREAASAIRSTTKRQKALGLLASETPVTPGYLGLCAGIKGLGESMMNPALQGNFSLGLVAKQWSTLRRFIRTKGKGGVPRHLINPERWGWNRLLGALAAQAIRGMYTTVPVKVMTGSGITLEFIEGSWDRT